MYPLRPCSCFSDLDHSGWVPNTSLTELTPEKASDSITEKMRKDLREAFELASQNNPIDYYKDVLKQFQEELIAQEEAKKEAAATPKKSKKGKAKAPADDLEMDDVDDDVPEKPKSKKRKAEDDASVSGPITPFLGMIHTDKAHTDTATVRLGQEAQDQAQHFYPQGGQWHSQGQRRINY